MNAATRWPSIVRREALAAVAAKLGTTVPSTPLRAVSALDVLETHAEYLAGEATWADVEAEWDFLVRASVPGSGCYPDDPGYCPWV